MGLGAALVGGASGFGIQIFANAMRKVPLSRREFFLCSPPVLLSVSASLFAPSSPEPWNHVGLFLVGCWAGNAYVRLERNLLDDINQIRADKGLPPLAHSAGW
eukprot:CAMPEP_0116850064 /NCGR_PEP_ID=MMETSP0418-20121206/15949_1 /TAXON_ID=1158023 /ORGANISM="Astrosyne radiata, Strain 13vi08-1A" /LENGTH=102 /DNA_ID=CAMNT_0004481913 /DNA_START=102 /DNA_END=407 /DNA_ORIENTATION=+